MASSTVTTAATSTPAATNAEAAGGHQTIRLPPNTTKPGISSSSILAVACIYKPITAGRKMTDVDKDIRKTKKEFPFLAAAGLYVAKTKGDGNCLFYALAEQLYGDAAQHLSIRKRVIEYIREHADYYKPFIDASNGTASRRNPKRGRSVYHNLQTLDGSPLAAQDIDRVFEAHLERMAKPGTYADNMEIQAFAQAYGKNVKIYEQDKDLIVHGGDVRIPRETFYIAHHDYEHYSSIRNISGPHNGVPYVREALSDAPPYTATNEEVDALHDMLHPISPDILKYKLEQFRGDKQAVVDFYIGLEQGHTSSSSSSKHSSKRGADSDPEDMPVNMEKRRLNQRGIRQNSVEHWISKRASRVQRLGLDRLDLENGSRWSYARSTSQNGDSSAVQSSDFEGDESSVNDNDDDGNDSDFQPRPRLPIKRAKDVRKQAHKNARKQLPIREPRQLDLSFTDRLTITI